MTTVTVSGGTQYSVSVTQSGSTSVIVSGNPDPFSVSVPVSDDRASAVVPGQDQYTVTPGELEVSLTLSGIVYYPYNGGNIAMEDVTVKLKDSGGTLINSVTTGSTGAYTFTLPSTGTYIIECDLTTSIHAGQGSSAVNFTDAGQISSYSTSPTEIEMAKWFSGDLIPFAGVIGANDAGRCGNYALTGDTTGFNYGEYVYWWAGVTINSAVNETTYPMTVDVTESTEKNIYVVAAGDFNLSGVTTIF